MMKRLQLGANIVDMEPWGLDTSGKNVVIYSRNIGERLNPNGKLFCTSFVGKLVETRID